MGSGRSVEVLLKEIEDRCAELAERDLTVLTEGEVLEAVERAQRIRSMTDGLCLRTAGALESSQAWIADGAASPAAWITWRCRVPRARASAAVTGARSLRSMPATEAALLAGEITVDHARLMATAQATAPEAFADGGEALLLESARTLFFRQFETVVRYWCHRAAPDLPNPLSVWSDPAPTMARLWRASPVTMSHTWPSWLGCS